MLRLIGLMSIRSSGPSPSTRYAISPRGVLAYWIGGACMLIVDHAGNAGRPLYARDGLEKHAEDRGGSTGGPPWKLAYNASMLTLRTHETIEDIDAGAWDALAAEDNPFVTH